MTTLHQLCSCFPEDSALIFMIILTVSEIKREILYICTVYNCLSVSDYPGTVCTAVNTMLQETSHQVYQNMVAIAIYGIAVSYHYRLFFSQVVRHFCENA